MNTQSIFDSWASYPTIFNVEPTILKLTSKQFYLAPNKLDGTSVIAKLKSNFGVKIGEKYSLKTPFLKINKTTPYNTYNLSLVLCNDLVIMLIKKEEIQLPFCSWNIEDITTSLKKKNGNNELITNDVIIKLLEDGKLKVKFNVSLTKDHGTLWVVEE
jgi:hypothetical protein